MRKKELRKMDQTALILHPLIFRGVISLLLLWCISKLVSRGKNLAPSPPKLPIIGNLHQIGPLAHQDLHLLSKKHGPVMLLHLGSVHTLVVSSADFAGEIMRTHDLAFLNRPQFKIPQKLLYHGKDVSFCQYGEYWRQVKSILVLRLLSSKRVQSFRSIREEETALLLKKIGEASGPVNLTEMFSEFTFQGVCRSAFGRKYGDSEDGRKFKELVIEFLEHLGRIDIGEFIPWVSWISGVNGLDKRVDFVAKGLDDFLEGVIRESKGRSKEEIGENFVDILLEIHYADTAAIDRDSIKALILDVFAAGTDTTSTVLDWAMAELLRHPKAMQKLQHEIRGIVGKDMTDDDEIQKIHYLKAVIKETLRLHPPLPTLVPRVATSDVTVKGHHVSAGTLVMINAWAIGRDPQSWDDPEIFKPERFLNSSIDCRGHDFELIPFGAGRRACPAITFAMATIEFVLANVVRKFDWKSLPEPHHVDMTETPGLTVRRLVPLLAIPTVAQ